MFAAAHREVLDKQDFAIRDYRIRGCYKIVSASSQIIPNGVITSPVPSDAIMLNLWKNFLVPSSDWSHSPNASPMLCTIFSSFPPLWDTEAIKIKWTWNNDAHVQMLIARTIKSKYFNLWESDFRSSVFSRQSDWMAWRTYLIKRMWLNLLGD